MAVAAPGGRTLAVQSSPYDAQLLDTILKHNFQNTDVEINCHAVLELFRPHLKFFGCDFRLAADALRGYMYLDERNTCPKSRLGTATRWRASAEVPTLRGVPESLHNRFLSEWVRIPVLHENKYVENGDDLTLYHGTIAKCGLKIAEIGFLPGPNGHVKNKRCHKGAFMSTNFYTDFYQESEDEDADMGYQEHGDNHSTTERADEEETEEEGEEEEPEQPPPRQARDRGRRGPQPGNATWLPEAWQPPTQH